MTTKPGAWAAILAAFPDHDAIEAAARAHGAAVLDVDDEVGHSATLVIAAEDSSLPDAPDRLACVLLREHDGSRTIFYVDHAALAAIVGKPAP